MTGRRVMHDAWAEMLADLDRERLRHAPTDLDKRTPDEVRALARKIVSQEEGQ